MPLKDGRVVWHHWTTRAIYDSLGNRVEYQGTGRDTTERVQHQEEIQRLKWGLENRVAERTAQLDGTVELRRNHGASFHIVFAATRQ